MWLVELMRLSLSLSVTITHPPYIRMKSRDLRYLSHLHLRDTNSYCEMTHTPLLTHLFLVALVTLQGL